MACCFFLLSGTVSVSAQQYDTAGWTTLKNYQTPEWYRDAKFGIYAHWGVFSVPAHYYEWYGYAMYKTGTEGSASWVSSMNSYHVSTYGNPSTFGYKDFVPQFKAENFNADTLISYVANAGARYYAHMTSHHESFIMYGTAISRWNCVNMGPKKDVGLQVLNAVKKKGLRVGISNHLAENCWFFGLNHYNKFDAVDTSLRDIYNDYPSSLDIFNTAPSDRWCNRWMALSKEMIDFFRPDYVYYDRGWSMHPKWTPYRKMLAVYQYNQAIAWGRGVYGAPGVALLYKDTGLAVGSAILDEEFSVPASIQALPFQCELSVDSLSWGYITNGGYRTPSYIINYMVNTVSKNGNFSLSIDPKADGTLPDSTKKILTQIGSWMNINSEAIYATRPADTFGVDGTNQIRFTRSKDSTVIYVLSQNWPGNNTVLSLTSFRSAMLNSAKISKITMLGNGSSALVWSQNAAALSITTPSAKPPVCNYCYVFKMYLDKAFTLPAAPSNLTDAYMSTGINLKWVNNSSKATLVKIEREANSSGTFTQIATVADSITTYTDLTTSSGVTYTYRVRAYNTSGNSGYSNEAAPQNEQPTAVHEQLLSGRTTQLQGESITTAIGRIHFTQEYAGKTKSVAVYSLSGRLLGMKTFNKNNIDLQKDFGVSKNVYIVKIANVR
jgi:alpha-L-fucosidase